MRLCKLCRNNKAELPDREEMGRLIKTICRRCHRKRLYKDIVSVPHYHDGMKQATKDIEDVIMEDRTS